MRLAGSLALALLVASASACTPRADGPSPRPSTELAVPLPSAAATPPPAPRPAASAVGEDDALPEGRVAFVGMVRPVKGGHEVRGVFFDGESIPTALAKSSVDGVPSDADWFLGAKVRVTATLIRHESPPPRADGLAEQRREGSFLEASKLELAELVARAEVLEGPIHRSKGLFQIGDRMVSRSDLEWSLPGGFSEGDRVRLWGQPRTHVCDPRAQCLQGGSIPLFDVGRGKKLP